MIVLKQVRLGPGSFEPNIIVKNLVDQNPIRLDMAVPVASPIPTELMIATLRRKWLFCEEEVDNSFAWSVHWPARLILSRFKVETIHLPAKRNEQEVMPKVPKRRGLARLACSVYSLFWNGFRKALVNS